MENLSYKSTSEETVIEEDDRDIIEAGYKPKLYRKMGFFASFAISFSFMSVLMGVFSNYGYVLNKAGPFGIWTWLIVGAGQLLVSFVFAEMAGRIPLTGALYNWNNKLSHPSIAVTVHWLTVFAYIFSGATVMVAMMGPLQTFFGKIFDIHTIRWIGIGLFIIQLFISVYGIRLATYINKLAVVAEIIAIIVFGLALTLIVFLKGQIHPVLLATIPTSPINYWPAFLMCTILGAWTLFGFETPSDLSEETKNPKIVTPKSIISSVLVSVLLGFFFLVVITMAIPNLSTITASADPVSSIMFYHLGNFATEIFILFVLLAMFGTSLLSITLASRLLFAVSRDKHFIAHEKFTTISKRGIPLYASLLVALLEIILFLTMYSVSALAASAVIILFSGYLITVINFGFGLKKLPPTKNFSLGKWHWLIVITATIWLIFQISILVIPAEFHKSALIAGTIFIFSIIQYPLHKLSQRKKITAPFLLQ